MKRFFLIYLISIFGIVNSCIGQEYKYVYYFDNRLASIKSSKATIIGRGFKEDQLLRLDYYNLKESTLLIIAHYTDTTLATLEGLFTSYYPNGKPRQQGIYKQDLKNDAWQKWDSTGRKTDSVIYRDNLAVAEAKFGYYNTGALSYYSVKDSLADTYSIVSYDSMGVARSDIFFKGQVGIRKRHDSTGTLKVDTLFSREEKEAAFPGGQAGWISYLQRNLNPLVPVTNGAPVGKYQVIVKFIVKKDGSLGDIKAETKFGFGMEEEVVRIIKNGPEWIPAVQYGHNVNAYRRQPVTFVVSTK